MFCIFCFRFPLETLIVLTLCQHIYIIHNLMCKVHSPLREACALMDVLFLFLFLFLKHIKRRQ
jgi:hypothetical protein